MPDLNREINEYVAYITPEIDVNQWKAVSSKIEGVLGSGLNAVTNLFNKKLQKAREELDKLQKEQATAKAKLLEITQIRQQKEDVNTQLSQLRSIDVSTEKGKEKYRELGGEIITIGADAHAPEHVAYDFASVPDILRNAGFRYYTVFDRRKPQFIPLP